MGRANRMSWSAMGGKQRDCRGSVRWESSVFAPCLAPRVQVKHVLRLGWFVTIKKYYSARRIRQLGSSIGSSCSGHGDSQSCVRQIGVYEPVGISATACFVTRKQTARVSECMSSALLTTSCGSHPTDTCSIPPSTFSGPTCVWFKYRKWRFLSKGSPSIRLLLKRARDENDNVETMEETS